MPSLISFNFFPVMRNGWPLKPNLETSTNLQETTHCLKVRLTYYSFFISANGNYNDDRGYGAEMAAWLDPDDVNDDVITFEAKSRKSANQSINRKNQVPGKVGFAEPASPILLSPLHENREPDFDDDFDIGVIFRHFRKLKVLTSACIAI